MTKEWEIKKYFCNIATNIEMKIHPQPTVEISSPSMFLFKAFTICGIHFYFSLLAFKSLDGFATTNHVFVCFDL